MAFVTNWWLWFVVSMFVLLYALTGVAQFASFSEVPNYPRDYATRMAGSWLVIAAIALVAAIMCFALGVRRWRKH